MLVRAAFDAAYGHDTPAPVFEHGLNELADHLEYAEHIDVEHALPVLVERVEDGGCAVRRIQVALAQSGVVDQHVDGAVPRNRLLKRSCNRGCRDDISSERQSVGQLIVPSAVETHHTRATFQDRVGVGAPHAAGRARNDDDAIQKSAGIQWFT
jgi:hypothetical protein